jgi:hypothetical protein
MHGNNAKKGDGWKWLGSRPTGGFGISGVGLSGTFTGWLVFEEFTSFSEN